MAIHPQVEQVLAGFHLGGCSSCSFDPRQSLGEVTAVNGREVEPILVALNSLVAESSNGAGQVSPERLKTPNIQLLSVAPDFQHLLLKSAHILQN